MPILALCVFGCRSQAFIKGSDPVGENLLRIESHVAEVRSKLADIESKLKSGQFDVRTREQLNADIEELHQQLDVIESTTKLSRIQFEKLFNSSR